MFNLLPLLLSIAARDRDIRAAQAAREILDPYSTPLGKKFEEPDIIDFSAQAEKRGISPEEVQAAYQRATRKPKAYNVGRGSEVQKARSRAKSSITEIRPDTFKIKTSTGVRVIKGKENLSRVRIDPGAGGLVGVSKDPVSGKINVIPQEQISRKEENKRRAQQAYLEVQYNISARERAKQAQEQGILTGESLITRLVEEKRRKQPTGVVTPADPIQTSMLGVSRFTEQSSIDVNRFIKQRELDVQAEYDYLKGFNFPKSDTQKKVKSAYLKSKMYVEGLFQESQLKKQQENLLSRTEKIKEESYIANLLSPIKQKGQEFIPQFIRDKGYERQAARVNLAATPISKKDDYGFFDTPVRLRATSFLLGKGDVLSFALEKPVETTAVIGAGIVGAAVLPVTTLAVGTGLVAKETYDYGKSGGFSKPFGTERFLGRVTTPLLFNKPFGVAVDKTRVFTGKLSRNARMFAYNEYLEARYKNALVTRDKFGSFLQKINKDLDVGVYGRPFEDVFAARSTQTGKTNLRESAMEVGLGEPVRVNPADAPELLGIFGKRTRVTQDKNVVINSAKEPALALNTPTRPSKSIVTEDVAIVGKASDFNKLFGTERAEASSVGSGFGIFQSRFYPDSVRVLGTQAAKGSGGKFNVLEIFQGRVKGYNIDDPITGFGSTQKSNTVGRLDYSLQELTGSSKPQLTGKQVQSFENSFGVGKQLYVFDRADIKVRQFGTSKNPVAETFQYFPKPTSTGGFSNEATYNVFGEKVTIKKKGSVDVFKNTDSTTTSLLGGQATTGGSRQATVSILEPLKTQTKSKSVSKSKQKKRSKQKQQTYSIFESATPAGAGSSTDAVYGFRTPRQAQQARSRSSSRSGQRSFQSFFPILGQRSGQKSFQSPAYKPASLQVPGLTVSPASIQKPKVTQTPDQKYTPDITSDIIFDTPFRPTTKKPTTKKPPTKKPPIKLPNFKEERIQDKNNKAFNVFVKENQFSGRFVKVNRKPLSRNDALGLGSHFSDNTISQTFKIAPASGKPKPSSYDRFWRMNKSKFRQKIVAGQPIPLNPYVEKRAYAIDTPGEKNDLTVSQFSKSFFGRVRGGSTMKRKGRKKKKKR